MSIQILLNLVIAVVWMFLTNTWDAVAFFKGYIIGLGLIFLLRRFIPETFYLRRVLAALNLITLFFKELVISSLIVVKQVLSPKLNIRPGIFALHTDLEGDWEITVLCLLITLTPGTLSLEVSPDNKVIYIHAMDIPDAESVVNDIKQTFEKAIMEVTR
ncbi:Na+/H+ antiporter subunit E [Caldalkalibacillus salinus]|uniref:Na+/H+ antiporter subunit E n=1 Tax=Caldalkalibacillus salinus TaxID=2803787 RepID=UPI0019236D97|nr:Na+/H+ antiporter subunit E [Caldalkalibacillus salinus]